MKINQMSVLAIRILSLYCFAVAFTGLGVMFTFSGGLISQFSLLVFGQTAIWIVTGIIFWFLSEPLARKMFPPSEESYAYQLSFKLIDAYKLGFVLVGLIILTGGIPDLVKLFIIIFMALYPIPNSRSLQSNRAIF